MTESARCPNPVANFWEWYQRRQKRGRGPMARYSLDKCEESYRRSDWESFGYWFEIYLRERPRTPNYNADRVRNPQPEKASKVTMRMPTLRPFGECCMRGEAIDTRIRLIRRVVGAARRKGGSGNRG